MTQNFPLVASWALKMVWTFNTFWILDLMSKHSQFTVWIGFSCYSNTKSKVLDSPPLTQGPKVRCSELSSQLHSYHSRSPHGLSFMFKWAAWPWWSHRYKQGWDTVATNSVKCWETPFLPQEKEQRRGHRQMSWVRAPRTWHAFLSQVYLTAHNGLTLGQSSLSLLVGHSQRYCSICPPSLALFIN